MLSQLIWTQSSFGSQSFSPYSNAQGLNQDGCNGNVMRTRKNTVSCCTAQRKEGKVKGRSRKQLHFSKAGCCWPPLGTAGQEQGCCSTVLWLMRHLLSLTARICCLSSPPAKLLAAQCMGLHCPAARCTQPEPPVLPRAPRGHSWDISEARSAGWGGNAAGGHLCRPSWERQQENLCLNTPTSPPIVNISHETWLFVRVNPRAEQPGENLDFLLSLMKKYVFLGDTGMSLKGTE